MLENVLYVDGLREMGTSRDGGGPLKEVVAHVRLSNGQTLSVKLQLEQVGFDELNHTNKQTPLYVAAACDIDLCEKQFYAATDEEREQSPAPALKRLDGKALLVDGYWKQGVWNNLGPQGQKVMTLSCTTGAVAKCAHWGYIPNTPYKGVDLTPYYQACVRAARAMYLEDSDKSFTCPGTEIDLYDRLNIAKKRSTREFESLWLAERPTCIEHTRWQGCDSATRDGGTVLQPRGSCDPVNLPFDDWPDTLPESHGIIAISSSPGNNAGTCPDVIDDASRCKPLPSPP